VNDLVLDYGAYILLAYSMALGYLSRLKPSFAWEVIFVSAFPLLESLPLLEHDTVYGFGRLKWLLPCVLILALMSYEFLNGKKLRTFLFVSLFALADLAHILIYLNIYSR
jgi:hypothetical protein